MSDPLKEEAYREEDEEEEKEEEEEEDEQGEEETNAETGRLLRINDESVNLKPLSRLFIILLLCVGGY